MSDPFDPFAPASSESVWNDSKENAVSDKVVIGEGNFVATFKQSGGFEAPWIVIRGNTAAELTGRIGEAREVGLIPVVAGFAGDFAATKTGAPAPAPRQQSAAQYNRAPAQQYSAPAPPVGGEAPTCQHGTKSRIEGQYGPFWACPAPRNEPTKCKAVSIR